MQSSRERGAVLPLVALVLTALIGFTSLAVDLGYQRVIRRDMQAIADVVAMDLARRIDGSTAASLTSTMDAELARSVARNAVNRGSSSPTVTYELGTVDAAHAFTAVGPGGVPTAVKVTSTSAVDYFFRPGTGTTTRTAVAALNPSACVTMGSFALNLASGNSTLLNTLVGDALNVSAISYTGLASANISLLNLATQLGVGSVDQLASTSVSLSTLYVAAANVLQAQGDTANAAILNSVAASVGALPSVNLGTLLGVSPSSDAALAATVNALDLVAGSAFLANGQSFLDVPGLTVGLTPVMNLTSRVKVIQGAVPICGPEGTSRSTSQVTIGVTGSVVNLTVPVLGSNLSVAVGSAANPVSVSAAVAGATGTLQDIICGTRNGTPSASNPNGVDVRVVSALLQSLVSVPTHITGNVSLLGLGLVTLDISTTFSANTTSAPGSSPSTGTSTASFRQPPTTPPATTSTGTGAVTFPVVTATTTSISARVLGLPVTLTPAQLGSILDPISAGVVTPILDAVKSALLGPLTDLLGLNVAGADVRWDSVMCSNPSLQA